MFGLQRDNEKYNENNGETLTITNKWEYSEEMDCSNNEVIYNKLLQRECVVLNEKQLLMYYSKNLYSHRTFSNTYLRQFPKFNCIWGKLNFVLKNLKNTVNMNIVLPWTWKITKRTLIFRKRNSANFLGEP